jgi:hypothetical protein
MYNRRVAEHAVASVHAQYLSPPVGGAFSSNPFEPRRCASRTLYAVLLAFAVRAAESSTCGFGINVAKAEAHSSSLDDESAAEKVKGIISAKLGKAASIKITDIVPGKAIDSFCGVAEVEGAGESKEMPFAYLVQKNEVYFINGSDDRRAAMCDRL